MEATAESPTVVVYEQIRVDGTLKEASLSTDGKLRWKTETGSSGCLNVENEVLGFSVEGSVIRVRAFADRDCGLCCGRSRGDRRRKDFVLEPLTEESKRVWCEKLTESIDSLGRPKKLFILVNPFGGKKSALQVFHKEVKPLLEAADIQYTLQETQYQLHAKEIANSLDLLKYDGIICVSGDGVLVEVINGLLQREDWVAAIRMPLGVVPAGTGNGMVKSLLDSVDDPCTASNATLAIIRGFVADVDIESEKYRWMGSARLEFYCLVRAIRLRKYDGRVSFTPAPGYENYGDPVNQIDVSGSNFLTWNQNKEDNAKAALQGYQGPPLEDLEWRTIEGPFISVWLHNVPWGTEDTMPAPDAKFSDGFLDLIIIRDCPTIALLGLLMKMNDGGHVKSPYVMYLKVKAFRLEPGQQVRDATKGGIIDSDGEVLARGEGTYKCEQRNIMEYGPIQMTVDQGLATLFCPRQ